MGRAIGHQNSNNLLFADFRNDENQTGISPNLYHLLHRLALIRLRVFVGVKYIFVNTKGKPLNSSFSRGGFD